MSDLARVVKRDFGCYATSDVSHSIAVRNSSGSHLKPTRDGYYYLQEVVTNILSAIIYWS